MDKEKLEWLVCKILYIFCWVIWVNIFLFILIFYVVGYIYICCWKVLGIVVVGIFVFGFLIVLENESFEEVVERGIIFFFLFGLIGIIDNSLVICWVC